jgi:anti-sigma regulatory factor (Ser/Thr protein kinase)
MPADIDTTGSGRRRAGPRRAAVGPEAWATTASFPPWPGNVPRSRLLTRTALAAWGAAQLAEKAETVVSELVTNAVRHGRGAVSLALVLTADSLRISVSDSGPELPAARRPSPDDPGGRGLRIVDALCTAREVTVRLRGKTITCWLARDRPAAP